MKNLLAIISILSVLTLSGQNNPPVAVNDTVFESVKIGEFVTVNATANDYDPDGDNFSIYEAGGSYSHTDSTITYFIDFSLYGGVSGSIEFNYKIKDEFGLSATTSIAKVVLKSIINKGYAFLDVNNISARFNAFGNHFWDLQGGVGAQYEYPKGSSHTSIWNFTLWLGGMDENSQLRLAAERYQQIGTDYWTGPLSFDNNNVWIDTVQVCHWFKVWKLSKEEVEYHIFHWNDPGYEAIDNIINWPAHGDQGLGQSFYLAPFIDTNNDSIYDPLQGDYPLIRGDQSLFFIFNDQKAHTETSSQPIGIEIQGFAYAFDAPDDPQLNNTTFLSYKIFNRSQHTLNDTYAGLFCDIDLGNFQDDYVGCDVARGAFYGYNGDDYDEDWIIGGDTLAYGYGEFPPAQGIIVLGGPYIDADGEDNPSGECDESINGVGFGDGITDNERFGMNRFIYFDSGSQSYNSDPDFDFEYYNYLMNIWKDGIVMEYGGNGHPSSGAYGPAAKFMFPGLSDPCDWGTGGIPPFGSLDWTEETAGNQPFERRGLCSMGPFTLEPGAFHKIDIAFVTARGDSLINSVDLLKSYIDTVKTFYYKDPDHFGYQYLGIRDLASADNEMYIYPNPAKEFISINYSSKSSTVEYTIFNSFGQVIRLGYILQGNKETIPISELNKGVYIIVINDEVSSHTQKFIKQ
jgi:hypothetical protein